VPATVPILVTSLEPDSEFSEICETLVVNAHGCSLRSPTKLPAGIPVELQSKEGHWTMAHIVDCKPMGSGEQGWKLGAKLDQPDNFWGLETCPEDWARLPEMPSPSEQRRIRKRPATNGHLRAVVAELVEPLQAEVTELREKLAQAQPKRSQFDISLSYIPPEVQEKVAIRLRQELGEQVLQQTRQQSEQVLEATKEAIGKRLAEARNQFRQQLAQELQTVEQRAQVLSEEITGRVQEHLDAGGKRFQQQVLEAGIRLERRSEEFLRTLQQRLGEEHEGYRREMEKIQAAAASESSRLQAQAADLTGRMAKLDESAHKLESDLDNRLVRLGSDIISGARTQLEHALDVVLKELGTRNAKELGNQLEEARGQLKKVQKGIETSVSELLRTEVSGSLLSFGQTMEELAQDSVGRWRVALARDLNAVAKIMGEPFRLEAASDGKEDQEASTE
jgi:hypothetical protein